MSAALEHTVATSLIEHLKAHCLAERTHEISREQRHSLEVRGICRAAIAEHLGEDIADCFQIVASFQGLRGPTIDAVYGALLTSGHVPIIVEVLRGPAPVVEPAFYVPTYDAYGRMRRGHSTNGLSRSARAEHLGDALLRAETQYKLLCERASLRTTGQFHVSDLALMAQELWLRENLIKELQAREPSSSLVVEQCVVRMLSLQSSGAPLGTGSGATRRGAVASAHASMRRQGHPSSCVPRNVRFWAASDGVGLQVLDLGLAEAQVAAENGASAAIAVRLAEEAEHAVEMLDVDGVQIRRGSIVQVNLQIDEAQIVSQRATLIDAVREDENDTTKLTLEYEDGGTCSCYTRGHGWRRWIVTIDPLPQQQQPFRRAAS